MHTKYLRYSVHTFCCYFISANSSWTISLLLCRNRKSLCAEFQSLENSYMRYLAIVSGIQHSLLWLTNVTTSVQKCAIFCSIDSCFDLLYRESTFDGVLPLLRYNFVFFLSCFHLVCECVECSSPMLNHHQNFILCTQPHLFASTFWLRFIGAAKVSLAPYAKTLHRMNTSYN